MSASVRFGQCLREARELRGLTVEQLSRDTNIPVGHIEALELGRVHALPGAMYRRAEARAYAEAVGLDPRVVLADLQAAIAETQNAPARGTASAESGVTSTETQRRHEPALSRGYAAGDASVPPGAPYRAIEQAHAENTASAPGASVTTRAARAILALAVGIAALMWEQSGVPSINVDVVPASPLPTIDAATVMDEAVRLAEPPPPPPELRRALFDPRIAANGRRWPLDGRLDEGVLVVHSTPRGARVTVNGVGWGVTPVAIRYLPFGTLRVRVGKAEHAVQERVVQLTPEQPSRLLRLTLPELARRRAASPARAEGDMLVITTIPAGARVTVNGIGWGSTPVSIPHVPAGPQRVRVVKDRFHSEERVVTVSEGQPGRVAIALKPLS